MCRLFLTRVNNPDIINKINLELFERSYKNGNRHGYAYGIPGSITRTLDYDKIKRIVNKKKSHVAMGHLRIATTGSIEVRNTHLWRRQNWIFGHNGWVSLYSGYKYNYDYNYKKDKKSKDKKVVQETIHMNVDSFEFFKDLLSYPLTPDNIQAVMDETSFVGVAILMKQDFSEYWVIAQRDFSFIEFDYDGDKGYIISSQSDIVNTYIEFLYKEEAIEAKAGPFHYIKKIRKPVVPLWKHTSISAGIYHIIVGDEVDKDETVEYITL